MKRIDSPAETYVTSVSPALRPASKQHHHRMILVTLLTTSALAIFFNTTDAATASSEAVPTAIVNLSASDFSEAHGDALQELESTDGWRLVDIVAGPRQWVGDLQQAIIDRRPAISQFAAALIILIVFIDLLARFLLTDKDKPWVPLSATVIPVAVIAFLNSESFALELYATVAAGGLCLGLLLPRLRRRSTSKADSPNSNAFDSRALLAILNGIGKDIESLSEGIESLKKGIESLKRPQAPKAKQTGTRPNE